MFSTSTMAEKMRNIPGMASSINNTARTMAKTAPQRLLFSNPIAATTDKTSMAMSRPIVTGRIKRNNLLMPVAENCLFGVKLGVVPWLF